MKTTIVSVMLLLLSAFLKAQDSTLVLSKYEQFCTTQGRLIKTSTMGLGDVRSVNVEVLKTTDVKNGDSISVVRISPFSSGVKPLVADHNIYFSKEELSNVIALLEYYSAEIKNENARQFLYSYITTNDVRIACNYNEGIFSSTPSLSITKLYQHLRTPVREALWFGRKDLDALIRLLKTGQNYL